MPINSNDLYSTSVSLHLKANPNEPSSLVTSPKGVNGLDITLDETINIEKASVTLEGSKTKEDTSLSAETKHETFIACLAALSICSMMIENMAAFLPPYIEKQKWVSSDNYLLTSFDASLILSVF